MLDEILEKSSIWQRGMASTTSIPGFLPAWPAVSPSGAKATLLFGTPPPFGGMTGRSDASWRRRRRRDAFLFKGPAALQ